MPLQDAAANGEVEQLKRHIARDAPINAADQYGYTPLKRAIEGQHVEATKLLLEAGANPNFKDRDGMTPLISAATYGQKEIVEALLAKGADVKGKDNYDGTALHEAIRRNHTEIAMLLIEKGADVNAVNKRGEAPLTIARQGDRAEIVDLLTKRGAKEPQIQTSPYDDYGYAAGQAGPQGPGPSAAAPPRRADVQVDPNAIRAQLKGFEGLAAALKAVDDKSSSEQQAWIQRRIDNRTTLVTAVERQFAEEMAFLKPIATEEKAVKTTKAIDDLTTGRKNRSDLIGGELREQRRTSLQENRQTGSTMTGRVPVRGGRTRGGTTGTSGTSGYGPGGGYGAGGAYGAPQARTPMPVRRPGDANEPPIDPDTQNLIQAWLNAKLDDKTGLLEAVQQITLFDLDDLRVVAEEEQAKKTTAAIMGLMLIHQERVQKITQKWQEDDARMQKLQGRWGPQGMPGGRGMPGNTQPGQMPMRPGRRGR